LKKKKTTILILFMLFLK